MAGDNDLGIITGLDVNGNPVTIWVTRKRDSVYLSDGQKDHLVHPSNLRNGQQGYLREAVIVFHVRDPEFQDVMKSTAADIQRKARCQIGE